MTLDPASVAFADRFASEDEVVLAARDAADQYGIECVGSAAGALLTVLTHAARARTVAEIGTGTGVSGLYLARGMDRSGVLTTIDIEPEHHKSARKVFAAAGLPPERTRLITGNAIDVLPRLTDGGYDLVFIDGRKADYPAYADQALRLVRPGGLIVMDNALHRGRVADPAQRDPETTAIRQALRTLRNAEGVTATILPTGEGLAVATFVA